MSTFLISLTMGFFGAIAVVMASSLNWPTWVMFIAWVSYYVFGKSIKTAGSSFLQILAGILMGVTMQLLATLLTRTVGSIGFPIAVFLLIGSLAYITRLKLLNNMPAWFLGLIIFFGIHPEIAPWPLLSLLPPIFMGFIFAYLNDNTLKRITKH